MRILLTNDDGIRAPGIAALHKELDGLGKILTVAPLHGQSASGHGVTYEKPVFVYEVAANETLKGFGVEALPADCVKLAIRRLCDEHLGGPPDLVISGMNAGANIGINVVYSGTVAAALEASLLGFPAIAVSLHLRDWEKTRYDLAAVHARKAIDQCLDAGPLTPQEVLNINLPVTEEDGPTPPIRVAPMNLYSHNDVFERRRSPRGNPYFWSTGHGLDFVSVDENSDVKWLIDRFITVTPLHFDLTHHSSLEEWRARLEGDSHHPARG